MFDFLFASFQIKIKSAINWYDHLHLPGDNEKNPIDYAHFLSLAKLFKVSVIFRHFKKRFDRNIRTLFRSQIRLDNSDKGPDDVMIILTCFLLVSKIVRTSTNVAGSTVSEKKSHGKFVSKTLKRQCKVPN